MKKLVFAISAVLLALGCGSTQTENIHEKLLSYYPQMTVKKAFETHNNLVLYSFNVKAIRDRISKIPEKPSDAGNKLALVSAWEFPTKSDFKCENPWNYGGFATCLYDGTQVVMPPLDFDAYMTKNSAVPGTTGESTVYTNKLKTQEFPTFPTSAGMDKNGFMATRSLRGDIQREVTTMVTNSDKPITNFDSVKICLDELAGFDAVELVFLAESFYTRANSNAIQSPAMSAAQIGQLMPNFQTWGRNTSIQNAAFGSRWANGSETVKAVFVYTDEEKANEDYKSLSQGLIAIPAFFNGTPWYKRMNMTLPQMKVDGRKIIIEFDMEQKAENLQFPLLMRFADKFEDWGWLWLK